MMVLGAGDEVFENAIAQLERKYPFGSKKENRFSFSRGSICHKKWDGSIET